MESQIHGLWVNDGVLEFIHRLIEIFLFDIDDEKNPLEPLSSVNSFRLFFKTGDAEAFKISSVMYININIYIYVYTSK